MSKNQPKRGGRLKLELFFDTATWDPFDPAVAGLINVPMTYFYNRLLKPDPTLNRPSPARTISSAGDPGRLRQVVEQPDRTSYVFKRKRSRSRWNLAVCRAMG
ncbi:MAG: hypothetical protein U0531_05100 [Dehalococcoidia bacterium]